MWPLAPFILLPVKLFSFFFSFVLTDFFFFCRVVSFLLLLLLSRVCCAAHLRDVINDLLVLQDTFVT